MRFVHISDLHIGKRLREASLEADQEHILRSIADIATGVSADAVLIAGDVYDTSTPNVDSVRMLDRFLTDLTDRGLEVFLISGNHDSPERLGFGSRMMEHGHLFVSGVFSGTTDRHTVVRGGEEVDVHLLPFVKPVHVRRLHPDEDIQSYDDAVRVALSASDIRDGVPSILVTHQFVVSGGASPRLTESETMHVGGTEAVDVSNFDMFDYVALGHIHSPQRVGRDTVRYCGTPLKYSKSEAKDGKSVTVVDVTADGVDITTVPLVPLRDVRVVRGPLEGLIAAGKDDPGRDDLVFAELEDDAMDAMSRLREVYPNLLSLEVPRRSPDGSDADPWDGRTAGPPDTEALFRAFFLSRTGREPSEAQMDILRECMEAVR
ncbi:MAG: exonuclease SbcCD subunit D [Candidatus Methanomethylophilaceae archaeon]|nr:exonuclease SbcCD subunit D [Candidatus Methanomethylophilaceae archaeon]